MKLLLIVAPFLIISNFSSASCRYSIDPGKTTIKWKAFKTPKKIGVEGEFKKFTINTKNASTVNGLIESADFKIDTNSVNTGNKDRDNKIKKFFFNTDKDPLSITGKVKKVKNNTTFAQLKINDQQKNIKFDNKLTESNVTLTSSIDVLSFGLNSNLLAIHNACKALHEGKTWPDVEIKIEASIKKVCK